MRHLLMARLLLRLVLSLCMFWMSLLPDKLEAQGVFPPVSSGGVNNVPIAPGNLTATGSNVTTYFQNHSAVTQGGTGVYQGYIYDAVAHFERVPPYGVGSGVPAGWQTIAAPSLYQCISPPPGALGGINIVLLPGPGVYQEQWGAGCSGFPDGSNPYSPLKDQAIHLVGQPNGPVYDPPPPAEAENPGDSCNGEARRAEAGDPCDTKTGLYYQRDTDIEVPDVMPITLTRTYRTEDTASRVFGIGTSHPYDQYMLRDDLCTEARIILPDGAYIAFLRTSGTNCLDSTLQHTTTQTAFYAATLAWDQAFQRYRLKFKDGAEWRFSDYGSLVTMLDRNGNTLTLTRAAGGGLAGKLTKITTPNGRYLTFTYDASNRITQVTDILGRTITYTYDASGRLWKVTNPLTGVAEYTYDASHRLLTMKEPNGNTHVTNTYDANGRVATQTQADSTTYQFAYTVDGSGNVTQTDVTDPRGYVTRFTFTSAGLTDTATEALGQPEAQATTYEWQAGTNLLLSVTDTLSRKTAYTYDAKGNTLTVTRLATTPQAVTTTMTYEPTFNQVATVTDPLSHTITLGYDTKGNLTTITNALSKTTTITVNPQGQPLTIKDPLNNTTTFTYEAGDLVKVKDPLNRETQRILDAAGRLRNVTNPLGQKTLYTPDALDRITQLTDAINGNTAFAYDLNSNLLTVTDAKSQQTVYTYSNMNRTSSRKDPLLSTETYTYDNANRLTQVQQGTSTVTMGYDNVDRRTSLTLPNTNSVTSVYDAASQLTSLTYKKGATVLGDLTYTYDAAGNRIKTGGAFARTTIPPALSTVSYNVNNQQTTFGTNTETYDLNGNLSTVTDAGVTATYSWNARNQLTGISTTGFAASFSYDSFGRRTGRTVQGVVTNYVYDGLNPVQEKAGATVTANLLTGLGIDEFFTRTDGVGSRALLPDALGSTVALGDSAGTLQTQYTYEPFGYVTQTGSASTNSYKYTGREDDGSGLYYYRARYYHPRLQRFIGEDPIGFYGGGTNFYAYVYNDPLMLTDRLGLAAGDWWDALANYYRARQIADEELRKHQGYNDCDDAIRHADWNQRMAKELGYWYSLAFGTGHEIVNLLQGQPLQELRMDLHNNAVGRNAAGGSNCQCSRLQTSAGSGVSYPYQAGAGSSYPY